jgi:Fur family transcriptional regulator, zinc uptake regulator
MTMTNACSCEHDPATWPEQVEIACVRQGIQLTPLRKRVLDILSASASPLGAYAILEEMSRREGKAFAPPTVYRTLDFFLEHGFVHKIESLNAYAPCEHLDHAHHAMLLICETCGRSEEVEDAEVMAAISREAGKSDFALSRVMVEARGLCGRCAAARGSRAAEG